MHAHTETKNSDGTHRWRLLVGCLLRRLFRFVGHVTRRFDSFVRSTRRRLFGGRLHAGERETDKQTRAKKAEDSRYVYQKMQQNE
jgi:hypothetical protein